MPINPVKLVKITILWIFCTVEVILFFITTIFLFVASGACLAQSSSDERPASASTWEEGEGDPDTLAGTGIDEDDEDIPARIAEGDEGDGAYD